MVEGGNLNSKSSKSGVFLFCGHEYVASTVAAGCSTFAHPLGGLLGRARLDLGLDPLADPGVDALPIIMFIMIDDLDSFYNNLIVLYMTLMMVAPMIVLMIIGATPERS